MSLPTKIKMGIRDSWDNPDSDVQKSIAKLKSTLGVAIHIAPQWQLLWADLQSTYQDMGIFVPNLASVVYCWCTSLEALLDKGENEEWTDELLEKLGSTYGLNMLLEVRTGYPQVLNNFAENLERLTTNPNVQLPVGPKKNSPSKSASRDRTFPQLQS
jgi:hypothetical protein